MKDEIKTELQNAAGQAVETNGKKNNDDSPFVLHPSSFVLHPSAHPSSLRILLWDIDGTLVRARRNGVFKEYFAPAMQRTFGTVGRLWEMGSVSGSTDLQIIAEALAPEKITLADVRARFPELIANFKDEMHRFCRSHEYIMDVLPGVPEILAATNDSPNFFNALLTGNFEPAARLKLELGGVHKFFDFSIGAFGEESNNRNDLPAIAARSIGARFDYEFAAGQFIVIGDTPHDIRCARFFGAKAVAVATGRNNPPENLRPHNPDYLFNDLSDTGEVLRVLQTV